MKRLRGNRLTKTIEIVKACGHPNITATHQTTFELTMAPTVGSRGTCVIGVNADRSIRDLSPEFKEFACCEGAEIQVVLGVGKFKEVITGYGHPDLTFSHSSDIVGRKSDFICGRTLMIRADKAAIDLNRKMISLLKNPQQLITSTIII
ncbi:MAG: DUF371 domain-containing protein [Promethearchaeota archaeon]